MLSILLVVVVDKNKLTGKIWSLFVEALSTKSANFLVDGWEGLVAEGKAVANLNYEVLYKSFYRDYWTQGGGVIIRRHILW